MKNLLTNLTKPTPVMAGSGGGKVFNYNFDKLVLPNVQNSQQFITELKSLINITKNQ
jgi:hypothetical protein